MTPADPTPVPPHLSDAERALWEKADAASDWLDGTRADAAARDALVRLSTAIPEVIHSLLTALSSEREAGEEARKMLGVLIASAGGKAVLYPRMLKLDYTVHRADGEDGIVHLWSMPAAPSTETPR